MYDGKGEQVVIFGSFRGSYNLTSTHVRIYSIVVLSEGFVGSSASSSIWRMDGKQYNINIVNNIMTIIIILPA